MPQPPMLEAVRRLRRLAETNGGAATDAELLRHFAAGRDPAAFETLVWRHGPMVWGVCRRILRHEQDAEDAFQAAFLALARKAGSVGDRVGGWLFQVAHRAALRLRSAAGQFEALSSDPPADAPDAAERERCSVLLEEVRRLPERYRAAVVLCCLEGRSGAEAAAELGCPRGTIDSRLHWAKQRLRERLTRRGVAPAVALGVALPAGLARATVGVVLAGGGSARAVSLARGVLRAMVVSKLKATAAVLVLVGAAAGVGGGWLPRVGADPPVNPGPVSLSLDFG